MDTNGLWSLTPAFDVVWAYNPSGIWTNGHQLTINGKRDDFTREDIIKIASQFGIKDANAIIDSIIESTLKS